MSFFLSTPKRSLPTDILYNTSEAALQRQPSAIELGLVKHILQSMHTNTVEIRTVLLSVNVSMQQLTFVSSLGLSKFYATCTAKWDTPDLEFFYARVGLLPNLPHNMDL